MISVSDILNALEKIPEWVGLKRLFGRVHSLEDKVAELEAKLSGFGSKPSQEACPICETGTLKVTAIRPEAAFGVLGVEGRTLTCELCAYTTTRHYDPRRQVTG